MFAELLLWPMLGVGGIAALMFVVIVVQRLRRGYVEARTRRRRNDLLPVFSSFINGDASVRELRQMIGPSLDVAEEIIHGFLHELTGEGRARLLEAAEELGLVDRALRGLRSRNWMRRDLAAMQLGIYALSRTVPALVKRLADRRREVRYTAARSLGMIGSSEAVDALVDILDHPELIDTPRVLEIVQSMAGQVNEPLKAMLTSEEHPLEAKLLAIDLAGDLREHSLVGQLLEVLRSSNKEKVVRSIRALGKLSAPQSIEQVLVLARDRAWEVRAQALKVIGVLEIEEGIPLLLQGLSDSSYWVRHNAAESLVKLGERGCEALMEAQSSPDGFARDIAKYQLERVGISPNGNSLVATEGGGKEGFIAAPLLPSEEARQ